MVSELEMKQELNKKQANNLITQLDTLLHFYDLQQNPKVFIKRLIHHYYDVKKILELNYGTYTDENINLLHYAVKWCDTLLGCVCMDSAPETIDQHTTHFQLALSALLVDSVRDHLNPIQGDNRIALRFCNDVFTDETTCSNDNYCYL